MFCPKCGAKIEDDAVFCTYCGKNLSGVDIPKFTEVKTEPAHVRGQYTAPNQPNKKLAKKGSLGKRVIIGTVAVAAAIACGVGAKIIIDNQKGSGASTANGNISSGAGDEASVTEEVVILKSVDYWNHMYRLKLGNRPEYMTGFNTIMVADEDLDPYESGYRTDVLIAPTNGAYRSRIYDYDGNILIEGPYAYPYYDGAANLVQANDTQNSDAIVQFSKDFAEVTEGVDGFGGTRPFNYYIHNGKLYLSDGTNENVVTNVPEANGRPFLTKSDNGYGVATAEGTVLSDMAGIYVDGTVFSNGYIFLSDESGMYALFNGLTGEQLTNFEFAYAQYVSYGYAAVCEYTSDDTGKWALIDTTGKLVTDYMFETAPSPIYEGKAYMYVQGDGGSMLINVDESIKNCGGYINEEMWVASVDTYKAAHPTEE